MESCYESPAPTNAHQKIIDGPKSSAENFQKVDFQNDNRSSKLIIRLNHNNLSKISELFNLFECSTDTYEFIHY